MKVGNLGRALVVSAQVAVAGVVGLSADPAEAATMLYVELEELTRWSDRVVVGTVHRDGVFLDASDRITTRWRIEVETTLRGEHDERVSFVQWSGELDGVVAHVPGDAEFVEGGRFVVFLRGDDPNDLALTALAQSAWSVTAQPPDRVPGDGIVHAELAPVVGPRRMNAVGAPSAPVELNVRDVVPAGSHAVRDLRDVGLVVDGDVVEGRRESMPLIELIERVRAASEGE